MDIDYKHNAILLYTYQQTLLNTQVPNFITSSLFEDKKTI